MSRIRSSRFHSSNTLGGGSVTQEGIHPGLNRGRSSYPLDCSQGCRSRQKISIPWRSDIWERSCRSSSGMRLSLIARGIHLVDDGPVRGVTPVEVILDVSRSIFAPRVARRVDKAVGQVSQQVPTVESRIPVGEANARLLEVSATKMDCEHAIIGVSLCRRSRS